MNRPAVDRPVVAMLLISGAAYASTVTFAAQHLDSLTTRYHSELAACTKLHSTRQRATCLRDARAADAEARRGLPDTESSGGSDGDWHVSAPADGSASASHPQ